MLKVIKTELDWKKTLKSLNHDWYHTWDYHQIAKNNEEGEPLLLMFESDQSRICLPLLVRQIDMEWNDITSVYGYPGIVSTVGITSEIFSLFIEQIKKWTIDNKIVSIFSRLNSCIDSELKEIKQISESKGETVLIDLSLPLDTQWKNYRKNYRNLVKRLIREGFTCSWENSVVELNEFVAIYNETMDSLGASDNYYFTESYYQSLLFADDFETRIYSCYLNGQKVCTGLFIFCGEIVQYHLSGTASEFKNSAPTRLMIDTVRIDASKLGYKMFHLGGGISDSRDSLFNFKYGFSKNAIDFRVLKIITNRKKYAALSGIKDNEIESKMDGYFPLYRQTRSIKE